MMYRAFNEMGNIVAKGKDLERVIYRSNVDEFGGCIVDELGDFVYGFEWVKDVRAVKRFRKALKQLGYAKDSLEFWREAYVEAKRDPRSLMDTKLAMYDGATPREAKIAEAIQEIKEAKARIAHFERMVR